jgi:hypothetical protein
MSIEIIEVKTSQGKTRINVAHIGAILHEPDGQVQIHMVSGTIFTTRDCKVRDIWSEEE